jgi:hypothetical protein
MGKGNCHGKGFTEVEDFVCRVIAERRGLRSRVRGKKPPLRLLAHGEPGAPAYIRG